MSALYETSVFCRLAINSSHRYGWPRSSRDRLRRGTTGKLATFDQMQRYYFNVRDGHELATDEEGMLLASVDAAVREAKISLSDITAQVLRDGTYTGTISIEIRTEHASLGSLGLTYSVQMKSSALY